MCKSVPQMAVFSTLMSTSLVEIVGMGTFSIQIPGSAERLTSAFMLLTSGWLMIPWARPAQWIPGVGFYTARAAL
jgi:hypothetical protein